MNGFVVAIDIVLATTIIKEIRKGEREAVVMGC